MKVSINRQLDSSVLSLIGRYCNRMKSLTLNEIRIDNKIMSFFRMYGHKLEELYIQKDSWRAFEEAKQLTKFCPNLKTIYFGKIRSFQELNFLHDKYSQTMKILNVEFSYTTTEELRLCIEYITRFENLQSLTLEFSDHSYKLEEPIDDCLSLIGQKCNKLLKLDLIISNFVPISNRFFYIFSKFKAIKILKIFILPEAILEGSIGCFKYCKQLIDLDINYDELREDFFENVDTFVPKLQSLRIRTDYRFSDTFIYNFYSMKDIQRVSYICGNQYKTNWYFGKYLTEVMLINNGINVILVNDNCGICNVLYR